ncbi:MAG: phage major capsid protein [Dehalococcoidia bacterium]|jgi:hypothetical protein|nr:phage major capsid protein [Dehalococcoidia bacterium]
MSNYADLTNLVETLKNVYGDGLRNQFNDEKITYNQFPKSERKPAGNGYIFGIRYARSQSVGARVESGALPDPFTGKKDQGKITPKYNYGSLRITGPAIETAKGNQAAFVDSLADEIDDIYQALVVDLNRQCHWDGWGQLGRLSAGASYTGNATWAGTFDDDMGIMYFQEGQLVDFYVSAGTSNDVNTGTCAAGSRILSITPSTKVVIFEAPSASYLTTHPTASGFVNTTAHTIVAGTMAIKAGMRDNAWASSDTPTEMMGLGGIYDDGTVLASFENITVASNPKWAANRITNSGVNRELSIDLMLNAVDLARIRSGHKIDTIRMGLGQRRKYANLLLPDVRFAPTVLKGGYETLTFSGGDGSLQIVIDPQFRPNRIYFEPNGVIQKYELTPLGWGNLDGSQLHQRAGYDEWDAFLRVYTNLGVEQRNCLVSLEDLEEPTLY